MSFRTRLLVVFLLGVLLPMIALALFIRDEMTDRLTAQYERRVQSLVKVIEEDLAQERERLGRTLAALTGAMVDDNRFRRAAVEGADDERGYLLDYAGDAMHIAGLSMLQVQDEAGRIISSGHFRNEYDRLEPELPRLLAAAPDGTALVLVRAPDSPFLALARVDSLRMAGRQFTTIAGVRVERRFLARLARDSALDVVLVYPDGELTVRDQTGAAGVSPDAIVGEVGVPFIDSTRQRLSQATFHVTHDLGELHALRRSIDRWFAAAVVIVAAIAIILGSWLASRVSRPLVELADKTSRIDLDRLDIDFDTGRRDEIGVLSHLLGTMTTRLRASAAAIRDAERRATLGEVARQINHDIKNGLTPIRNVFRHLIELAQKEPKRLPEIFRERQGTIDSSISYLENLAANYARLSPRGGTDGGDQHGRCDVNEIVRRVVTDLRSPDGTFELQMRLGERVVVQGDPVALRRVLENLIGNAIDSLESKSGQVTVSTACVALDADEPRVRITVADTGTGMTEEQLSSAFDDFYTTKTNGTGLGLSIVRRLVMDLGGRVNMESELGSGSRFFVELPVAPAGFDNEEEE